MTSRNRGTTGLQREDEHAVDQFLADAGFPDDAGLRQVLLRLRALRDPDVPRPSAELLELMGAPATADIIPLDQRRALDQRKPWEHRKPPEPGTERKKARVVFTALAVAASLGVAGAAAAGNESIRRGAEGTIRTIVRSLTPAAPAAPPAPAPPVPAPGASAPAAPPPPGADGAAVVPVPAGELPGVPSPRRQEDAGPGRIPTDDEPGAAEDPAAPAGFPDRPRGASSAEPGRAGQEEKGAVQQPADVPAEVDAPGATKQEQPGEAAPQGRFGTRITDAPRPTATKQDPQH